MFDIQVTDFNDTSDVALSGTAGATTVVITEVGTGGEDRRKYNIAVSGMTTNGTVTVTIPSGVCYQRYYYLVYSRRNYASTSTDNTVTYDAAAPTVTIDQAVAQADPTNASPIEFTAVFSEPVTGFSDADVSLSGTAGATTAVVVDSGDQMTYTVTVSGMTGDGTVIAEIAAGVAQDAAGNNNSASSSTDNKVTYDATVPTCTINQAAGQADPAWKSPVQFTVVFSEPVTGFETGDVTLVGGAGATTGVVTDSGDQMTYTVDVSGMTASGSVIAEITFGVCQDIAGNANDPATFTDNEVTWDMKPLNVMMMPSSGTLLTEMPQIIRNQFVDPDGSADMRICYTLISDASRSWVNAVYLQYNSATNRMYLRNDANTSWGVGYAPGSPMIIENSQAQIFVEDSTVTPSGNYLTIDWVVKLKPSMSGMNLWGWSFVQDYTGGYDGWIKTGEFSSNLKLAALGVTPNAGPLPISADQAFTTEYYDANGYTDINRCYLLINDNIGQSNAVYLSYVRNGNKMYLRDDANTSWGTGKTPGVAGTLENSQCIVDVGATSVTPGGNILSVNWVVQLKPSMTGKLLNAWTYIQDNSANVENWKVLGAYYDQAAPVAATFSPTATIQTGTASVVTVAWSDANGNANMERCYALLTPTMGNIRYNLPTAQANAIYVRYNVYENKIYLKNDANTSWGTGYVPGTVATLSNTQGSIDVAATTVTSPDANTYKLNLMFTPAWPAATTLGGWLQVRDAGGALSDWTPMTPQAPSTPLTVVP